MTTFGTSSDTSNTTNNHDPLCPVMTGCPCEAPDELCCACHLITQVRADERQAEANRRTQQFGYWHDYQPGFP